MDIREAIARLTPEKTWSMVVGEVTATDGETADVQPMDETAAPLLGIDLGLGPTTAIKWQPEVGDFVVVALDSSSSGFVIAANRGKMLVDADIELTGSVKLSGTVELNGGENGEVINAPDLVEQLKKLTARVDGIINALKSCGQDAYGGALASGITAGLASITDKEDFSEITDENVTH